MLYASFKVGEKEFKLRAPANAIIDLEKKLGGRNPLDILLEVEQNGKLPTVGELLLILHATLQKYHHGMTFEKVLELYDEFVDEGKTYVDLIPIMMDAFEASGFFKKSDPNLNQ